MMKSLFKNPYKSMVFSWCVARCVVGNLLLLPIMAVACDLKIVKKLEFIWVVFRDQLRFKAALSVPCNLNGHLTKNHPLSVFLLLPLRALPAGLVTIASLLCPRCSDISASRARSTSNLVNCLKARSHQSNPLAFCNQPSNYQ